MLTGSAPRPMTWRELAAWRAYWELEPFGEERADLRVGHAAAHLAVMWAEKGARIKISDFMPDLETPTAPRRRSAPDSREAWEETKARARAFAEAK